MVFFYLVTTGWIFDISLCDNSINSIKKYNCCLRSEVCILFVRMYVCMYVYGHTYSKSMDQPGKVASPTRGQLNRKNEYFPFRVRA